MSKGFYCTLDVKLNADDVKKIEAQMNTLIEENLPIQRASFPKKKAIYLLKNLDQPDKVTLLKNIRRQNVTLYSLFGSGPIRKVILPPFTIS